MGATRYASILGLGFGDCGKGHFVDGLARRWNAHAVVRFNGGAQAGHNVVIPTDGKSPGTHHTFAQFGAGTLVAGVQTLLVDPMVVHPTALLAEAEHLSRIGLSDALGRLKIDGNCRITTPFHQAAGRLRELLRGEAAHGTCGVGVGETVRHHLEHPEQTLRYSDLEQGWGPKARTLLNQLQEIRETLLKEFSPQFTSGSSGVGTAELQVLRDETVAKKWMASASALARHCRPASFEEIHGELTKEGCVLFEGAQGVLLDEWRGFHPHTTWSSINTAAVDRVLERFGIEEPIQHYGVMRTYLTRHGAGPLPTRDQSLDSLLPEPHNSGEGWQGEFRRGHPDAVLLKYALEAAGELSGLFISHLDLFDRGASLKWCHGYRVNPSLNQWPQYVERLPLGARENLEHQRTLTELLQNVQPEYKREPICSAQDFLECIREATPLPVIFASYGPTFEEVHEECVPARCIYFCRTNRHGKVLT